MKRLLTYLILVASSAIFSSDADHVNAQSSSHSAAATLVRSTPAGAVKLGNSQIQQRPGYFCGLVKGKWLPGRKLSRGFFYPTSAEISNLNKSLKLASSRQKGKIRQQIAAIRNNLSMRTTVCSAIEKSGKNTSLTKVLSTQPQKWRKFIALDRAGTPLNTGNRRIRGNTDDVVFDIHQAVGLAQPENITGSNLLAVNSNGGASDALASGEAVIANFYSTPSGNLYVLFQSKTVLVGGGTPCLLAEVNLQTGVPTCIDETLISVTFTQMCDGNATGPIQLDRNGNIFYRGMLSNGRMVLRKYSNGQVTDLVNDNISIHCFLVLPDGSVILSGTTLSTLANWVRRLSPGGSLSSLVSGSYANFITQFGDGNVYFGVWGGAGFGVRKFHIATSALDPKYWISGNTNGIDRPKYFDADALCSGNWSQMQGFCGTYGSFIQGDYTFAETGTFVVSGAKGQTGAVLMQYHPTVEKQESSIANITLSQGGAKKIALSGTSSEGFNITTLYDTETRAETIVADASNEIEMYNIMYVESVNKIMFNGLRFSDNQFVVGEITLQ